MVRLLSSLLAILAFATAPLVACSGSTSPNAGADASTGAGRDSGPCPDGEVLLYPSAGCGADAKPQCSPPDLDACGFRAYCGCDGVTFQGLCSSSTRPYAYLGACGAEGGPQSEGGATLDSGSDE